MSAPRGSVLQPLRAASDALLMLRQGAPDAEAARAAILRVIDAIEASLRRLLRDDPEAPMELRLRALAPDELVPAQVVAELRQRDRIGIESAASFHELLGVRRRLAEGSPATPRDAEATVRMAERLEREVADAAALPVAPPPPPLSEPPPPLEAPPDAGYPASEPVSRGVPPWLWAVAVLGLLLVVLLGVWLSLGRRDTSLEEGIALFRSGELARAAPHFRRRAQANPRDATPRLYLARIYRRTGEADSAATELRRALDLAPEDAGVYRELGLLFLDLGQNGAAIRPLRRAVELDPDNAEGWIMLIQALRLAGQHGAAQRVLAQAPAEVRALLQSARGPEARGTPPR
ncbi:MAG TPA: tetratricopeptide repeat protein [Longimicrobiaceae bacterium]|nr:tetratricopeptide repeat protein [Longimicrobiaceae bacterium]